MAFSINDPRLKDYPIIKTYYEGDTPDGRRIGLALQADVTDEMREQYREWVRSKVILRNDYTPPRYEFYGDGTLKSQSFEEFLTMVTAINNHIKFVVVEFDEHGDKD